MVARVESRLCIALHWCKRREVGMRLCIALRWRQVGKRLCILRWCEGRQVGKHHQNIALRWRKGRQDGRRHCIARRWCEGRQVGRRLCTALRWRKGRLCIALRSRATLGWRSRKGLAPQCLHMLLKFLDLR